MPSKRSHEGYLLIDHRNSPGIPDEAAVKAGLPVGAGRGIYESATYTCSHCQTIVVINPLRTRAREWCAKCDHYLCDRCAKAMSVTGECLTFQRVINEYQDANS